MDEQTTTSMIAEVLKVENLKAAYLAVKANVILLIMTVSSQSRLLAEVIFGAQGVSVQLV